MNSNMERLQKILARAGLASRRMAEAMIMEGRVAVDGQVVTALGSRADVNSQVITLDGRPVGKRPVYHYIILHKPAGLVSTRVDPQNRPTIMSLIPPHLHAALYPVGRLDLDSEGLMLLTNDGELAYRLMHPKFKVPKTYQVWVSGQPEDDALERLRNGIMIEGKKTAPAEVTLLRGGLYRSQLQLVLVEGRKREVRLMCQAVGHPVVQLVRTRLGILTLGSLIKGKSRVLLRHEVEALQHSVGLGKKGKQDTRGAHPKSDKPYEGKPDKPYGTKPDKRHRGKPDKPYGSRPDKPYRDKSDKSYGDRSDKPSGTRPDKPARGKPDKLPRTAGTKNKKSGALVKNRRVR